MQSTPRNLEGDLTVAEFCAQQKIKPSCFYKHLRDGKIRSFKRWGRRIIPAAESERIKREGT
jgi:hypothetical protein